MATVNYSWTLPTVGASVNTWGTLLNNILIDIDAKMFPRTGGTITGDTSVTGTLSSTGRCKVTSASDAMLQLTNSTASTGKDWLINSHTDGSLYFGVNGVANYAKISNIGLAVTGMTKTTTYFSANDQGYIRGDRAGYLQFQGGTSGCIWSNNGNSTDQMALDTSGNLLVGATSGTEHTLQKSAASGYAATISNTNSSDGYVLQLKSSATLGASWNLIDGFANGVGVFRVSGNGDVANYNNSYGSISSKEYKVNIVDTTPKLAKLLKYRVVNYSLKDDPGQLKQIGLIWEELYEISPGLCEETPEFADVEIEPARTEIKVTQRQKTRTEESTRYEVLLVDGQWTKLPVRTEVQVPLFDLHPLFEQDGSPVMEVAEPATEARPALYDKDGNEVTPAVEAKPAVMRQVMLQVPVMEDVEETVEIPAKTESRPTGKTIKSVKYSVLVPMLVKAMQEQQAQIEELKAKVGA